MMPAFVDIRSLTKSFGGRRAAVDDVSFSIRRGATVGLVGESGSGKSTLGRMILGLIPPDGGDVLFDGELISRQPRARIRALRSRLQMVFQDPVATLNPRHTVAQAIALPMLNFDWDRARIKARTAEVLAMVGLDPSQAGRYPHQFSGGQCQRIGIARALALGPDFLFLDEPISALDVSVQAQIVNLLVDLRDQLGLTYLFVSHELKIVRHFCDEIVVLYHGRALEIGPAKAVYDAPLHPYTVALRQAVLPTDRLPNLQRFDDAIPDVFNAGGCLYAAHCPRRFEPCLRQQPNLHKVDGRRVACHLFDPAITGTGPVFVSPKEDA